MSTGMFMFIGTRFDDGFWSTTRIPSSVRDSINKSIHRWESCPFRCPFLQRNQLTNDCRLWVHTPWCLFGIHMMLHHLATRLVPSDYGSEQEGRQNTHHSRRTIPCPDTQLKPRQLIKNHNTKSFVSSLLGLEKHVIIFILHMHDPCSVACPATQT